MKCFKGWLCRIIIIISTQAYPNVELPSIFSDNMVLQRNAEAKIWGWADPGEEINLTASWAPDDTLTVKGNRQAEWSLTLSTPAGPGPYTINISGYNSIILQNVLVGEVWIASGQSNMEWSASAGITNAEEAIANAANSHIRFFDVPKRSAEFPQNDVQANWTESTPKSMQYFSAIAYFFGKKLEEELNVPIGLISSNWGGTPAEIWIPEEAFAKDKGLTEAAGYLNNEEWGPSEPSRAYNGMISPIVPFTIAGVIWYQGETNTANPQYYELVFSSLIRSWRTKWETAFPFYFAQIAPFNYGEDNFSGVEVRDAQRRTLKLAKTGMVFTGDVGNFDDIHPKDKLSVGKRFADLALTEHYHKIAKEAYGPLVEKVEQKGKKIEVVFAHAEGLHFKDKNQNFFEVADEDKNFQIAKVSTIKGNKVILNTSVDRPKYVRYAWKNAIVPDLYNKVGLPASSFMEELK